MERIKLVVNAGAHERQHCPVKTTIPLEENVPRENLVLWDESNGKAVPVQAWQAEGRTWLGWIVGWMEAGESRDYSLRILDEPRSLASGVSLVEGAGQLHVGLGDLQLGQRVVEVLGRSRPLVHHQLDPIVGRLLLVPDGLRPGERRPQLGVVIDALTPIFAVLAALLVGAVMLIALNANPIQAYAALI